MKVLIVGANGQLGQELQITAGPNIEAIALGRDQLDIANQQQVDQVLADLKPQLVINAAAYTAVDKAEQESELAYQINRDGVANLAAACQKIQARLIQLSTDFVFDGCQSTAYKPADVVNPLGCYGESKYAGEQAIQTSGLNDYLIVRTAWVYSSFGANFVKTMLRLMAEKDSLGVVADQLGTPSYARELARAIWKMAQQPELRGILHWTDAGVASWYDFAVAIQEEALEIGLLTTAIPISPISTDAYPTPAKRPTFSVLDKTETWNVLQYPAVHWRIQLRKMLKVLVSEGAV